MQYSSYQKNATCHLFNWIDCFKCTLGYTNLQNISISSNQDVKNGITILGEEWMTGGEKKAVIAINKHKKL